MSLTEATEGKGLVEGIRSALAYAVETQPDGTDFIGVVIEVAPDVVVDFGGPAAMNDLEMRLRVVAGEFGARLVVHESLDIASIRVRLAAYDSNGDAIGEQHETAHETVVGEVWVDQTQQEAHRP